jgi:hypothetical protein
MHDWLLENVGGAKYLGHRSKTDKQKSGYNWQLHGKENMREFIEGVLPYLVLKRDQALLALETIAIEGKNPELRRTLYLKMKGLNRKGKTVETNTPDGLENGIIHWVSYPETYTATLPKIESELP